jgi:hypothetical protein
MTLLIHTEKSAALVAKPANSRKLTCIVIFHFDILFDLPDIKGALSINYFRPARLILIIP